MLITLKLATTLDGRIATRTGQSKWITSSESRREVHHLRAQHEAVLVGVNTVLADDPMLNARDTDLPLGRQPHRIVFDTSLRTPETARVLRPTEENVFLVCAKGVPIRSDLSSRATIVPVNPDIDGRPGCEEAVLILEKDYFIHSLFIEGGGQVAASFLRAGLVDRIEWFRAPILIGSDGRPALGVLGVSALDEALPFMRKAVRMMGCDLWETYERKRI